VVTDGARSGKKILIGGFDEVGGGVARPLFTTKAPTIRFQPRYNHLDLFVLDFISHLCIGKFMLNRLCNVSFSMNWLSFMV